MTNHEDYAEQRLHVNELIDCYGPLLTDKQKAATDLYYRDDLSLSEVSDVLGISRQGVLDSLHRSVSVMEDTEKKLGILKKEQNRQRTAEIVRELLKDPTVPDSIKSRFDGIDGEF